MYLKCHRRSKDGKEHRYWSIVESRRCAGGKTVQRPVLYLGEINDSQHQAWCQVVESFDEPSEQTRPLALFPSDRQIPDHASGYGVQVRLDQMELHRPRQWGACWLASHLYEELELGKFWTARLPKSREGTSWTDILQTLVCYRMIDPGSEWRLHRQWFEQSAMGDLLGRDYGLVEKNSLYRCLDKLVVHKQALFGHLKERWQDLFETSFEILLYDLTSTYFESDPPFPEGDKRRFGYSRDKRPDCVQVVIALVVTPEGFPLGYEVLSGNTSDKTTLRDFLAKIEQQYGKAERIWVMDRGIPTEEVLCEMRASTPPVFYIVGTPKARLGQLESQLVEKPWAKVRQGIDVKLLPQEGELYVLAQSHDRINKERAMRRRQLKWLWQRLQKIAQMKNLSRDALLFKLGAAKNQAPSAWRLVDIHLPEPSKLDPMSWSFHLNKTKLREVRKREGRYLLRTNLTNHDPAKLWEFYIQLTQIEQAFKDLKNDLSIRPVYHQLEHRIEAHIFVSFLAYCLQVTLKAHLLKAASGLTPRAVLEKFASMQMLDVHFPLTDGRTLILSRHTEPEVDHNILLQCLNLSLPPQPPPRISLKGELLLK